MKKFIASALFGVVLALAFVSTAEADEGLDEIEKGLHEIQAAKAKLSALDEKLAKTAAAFGPEGKEIYEALRAKAKTALKKGVSWLKKKFAQKVGAAKRNARHWDMKDKAVTETEKRSTRAAKEYMYKREWDVKNSDLVEQSK